MHWEGILIGVSSFLIIGIFHPVVIKAEYHWSKKAWPVFFAAGLVFLGLSLWVEALVLSAVLGVLGFTCLWSIRELYQQEERVKRGWFPQNPKRSQEQTEGLEEPSWK